MFLCSSLDFNKKRTTNGQDTKRWASTFQPSDRQQAKFQCHNFITRL